MARWYRRRKNNYRYRNNYYYNSRGYDNYNENPVAVLIVIGILYLIYKFGVAGIIFLFLAFIIIKIWKTKKAEKTTAEIKNDINNDIAKMVSEVKEVDTSHEKIKNEIHTASWYAKNISVVNEKDKTTNSSTPQAKALREALIKRGIKCELEKWDGYKHIDIAIPWAKLNIEIDGIQHYTDPKQMTSDCQRTYYSIQKGFKTIRYPNFVIEKNLDRVADGIASVARNEYYKRT